MAKFQPGKSGNPAGKPKGTQNLPARLAEAMGKDDWKDIVTAQIEKAKGGDVQAAKLFFDRLWPLRKGAPLKLDGMPPIKTVADALTAVNRIMELVAEGAISPEEGQAIAGIIERPVGVLFADEMIALKAAAEKRSA